MNRIRNVSDAVSKISGDTRFANPDKGHRPKNTCSGPLGQAGQHDAQSGTSSGILFCYQVG